MRAKHRARLACLASSAAFLALLAASPEVRADGSWTRHPTRPDTRTRPASVPTDYVFTHNGFFQSSCVYILQDDEIVESDRSIRATDGTVRDQITDCSYARYDFAGNAVAGNGSLHRNHKGGGGGSSTYDGWLESYTYASAPSSGSNLSTKWIVPTPPSSVGSQDIAFFNDFESNSSIIQPVLDFSELPGQWAMEAESLVGNNDVQSKLVGVNPGDTLVGTVVSSACSGAGVCTWTITLSDSTTGTTTTQTTKAVTDALDEVDIAVLETYGVDACNLLPASGEVPFFDNSLTTSAGASEPETYTFYPLAQNGVNAEVPTTCGFGGTDTGGDYVLLFGENPAIPDGGVIDDAGGSSSSGSSSGSTGVDSGTKDAGGSSSSGSSGGTSSSGSGSSSGTSGSSSGIQGGSSSGTGSSSGSGSKDAGATNADTDSNLSSGPSGCGCSTIASGGGRTGLLLALGLLLTVGLRRRRTS